jgi:hypothetical protein
MTPLGRSDRLGSYPHFRLNFEQQGKRAKYLLKAARAGEADALARFRSHPPQLAEAQNLIARELRFENWAALKHHTAAMARERDAMFHTGTRRRSRGQVPTAVDGYACHYRHGERGTAGRGGLPVTAAAAALGGWCRGAKWRPGLALG